VNHVVRLVRWLRAATLRRWGSLLFISVILGWGLTALHLPAGVLLGCMLAGILLASHEMQVKVPSTLFVLAQGVLGCLMARSLQPAVLAKVAADWPTFLGAAVALMAASAWLGWLLMRRQILPGTTAVWGLAPGAASAMVLMAQGYGADARLVAFMQYLRVAMVTALATLVAWWWSPHTAGVGEGASWLAPPDSVDLLWTLMLVLLGSMAAHWLLIPAGALLIPLVLGTALQAFNLLTFALPPVLLAFAYAVIGWSIGLRFTRLILAHAWRALPAVLGAILALIVLGVLMAVGLNQFAGFDPLTAYLATSPGGADSVAIIAASSAVDAGFVMAMQMARFMVVLALGPGLSKWVAGRTGVS